MSEVIHAHGPLRAVAAGLHVAEGTFGRSPMGRRMSVVAAPGGLLLHSAMRLREEELARLDALGPVRWILAPNRWHASDAPFYADRHPGSCVLAPEQEAARLRAAGLAVDGTVERDWPAELQGLVTAFPVRGLRIGETALHHVPSRTLVVNDLCMNFAPEATRGLHRLLMRANGVLGRLAPSRLLRVALLRDPRALAGSLAPILQLELDRVVVSHGSIFEGDGRTALKSAFAFLPDV